VATLRRKLAVSSAGRCANGSVVFQFNMGKKFGGYSWLRSADSRRRRLEYFLGNKWQRDGDSLGQVSRETLPNGATSMLNLNYAGLSSSEDRFRLHVHPLAVCACH
jgi:hypothetical protein